MSHSVKVTLIADQEIELLNRTVNVHDIESIRLNSRGQIIDAFLTLRYEDEETHPWKGWLSKAPEPTLRWSPLLHLPILIPKLMIHKGCNFYPQPPVKRIQFDGAENWITLLDDETWKRLGMKPDIWYSINSDGYTVSVYEVDSGKYIGSTVVTWGDKILEDGICESCHEEDG